MSYNFDGVMGEWVEESRKHYLLEYDKLFIQEFHFDKDEKRQGEILSKMRNKLLSGNYNTNDMILRAYRMWYRDNKVRLFQTSLKEHFEICYRNEKEYEISKVKGNIYKKGCFGEFINFKNKIEIKNFIQLKSLMDNRNLSFEENIEYSVVIKRKFVPDEIVVPEGEIVVEETPEIVEVEEFNLNEDCCNCKDNFIRKELIIHKNKFYCGDCNDKRKKEKKENNEKIREKKENNEKIRKKKEDKLLKKSVIDEIPIEPEKKKVIKKKKKIIKKDNPVESDNCPDDNLEGEEYYSDKWVEKNNPIEPADCPEVNESIECSDGIIEGEQVEIYKKIMDFHNNLIKERESIPSDLLEITFSRSYQCNKFSMLIYRLECVYL